jgi:hypothetical protein
MSNQQKFLAFLMPCFLAFYGKLSAQIPVDKEPHHKVVLENEYVRVLDGYVAVHDSTPVHVHAANSVVIFLSKSRFGIRVAGEPLVVADVNPGDIRYVNYGEKPVSHIVTNEGESGFHFIVVELLNQREGKDSCSRIVEPGITLPLQQKTVRAYQLDINSGKKYLISKSNCAHIVIAIWGNVSVKSATVEQVVKPGSFEFYPAQKDIEIKAGDNGNANCLLLELQ